MTADDASEYGYEPDVDADAAPHGPNVGATATERSWRLLGRDLTSSESVHDLVRAIEQHGWVPPLLALLLAGVVRGGFEHLSEPFAMSQGYVFPGWGLALGINLVFGVSLVAFSWFLYFGVVGAFAGYFSEGTTMAPAIFKAGGYLMLLFVPLVAVGAALVLTIPAPEAVVAGVDPTAEVVETHRAVAATLQMRVVDAMMAAGWVLVGFLLLPVVGELYDVDRRASVLSVLPVTLVAVTATQLV